MPDLDPFKYRVAWIAPLEIEAKAALLMLDKIHVGGFPVGPGHDYIYRAGEMCGHNVVIATLSSGQEYGTGAAAALASQVKIVFPNIWFGLLVGVAAGLPKLIGDEPRDIRLGDVLVALPEGESAGLVAYDLGKMTKDGFQLLRGGHVLARTESVVCSAIGDIQLDYPDELPLFRPYYLEIEKKVHRKGTFEDPGQENDVLYQLDADGIEYIVKRDLRPHEERTRVWYGPIGSGDKLMRHAAVRDHLRDKYHIIGLEMEAAGTMNRIPVGVIRGVCDYGDEHKNKVWQPYAAAMAAAYAKAVLQRIRPKQHPTESMRKITPTVSIPLPRDKSFVNRGDYLQRITESCDHPGGRAALFGLGGVGKSQIAIEYAYRFKDKNPDGWVFWIYAETESRVREGFRTIARDTQLPQYKEPNANIPELVYDWLSDPSNGPWLLVLDSADDKKFLESVQSDLVSRKTLKACFPQSSKGSLLVTTRDRAVALSMIGSMEHSFMVGPMTETEALDLFSKRVEVKAREQSAACELVQTLNHIPLAISQAAAYIEERSPHCTISDYLARFRRSEQDMVKLLEQEDGDRRRDVEALRQPGGSKALSTWLITFDYIQRNHPAAAELLQVMSVFNNQGIPEEPFNPAKWLRMKGNDHTDPRNPRFLPVKRDNTIGSESVSDIGQHDEPRTGTPKYSKERWKSFSIWYDKALDWKDVINLHVSRPEHETAEEDILLEDDTQTLVNFSLIWRKKDSAFGMHALVQSSIKVWLRDQKRDTENFDTAVQRLSRAFPYLCRPSAPDLDPGLLERCNRLTMHVHDLRTKIPVPSQSVYYDWKNLLLNAAWYEKMRDCDSQGLDLVLESDRISNQMHWETSESLYFQMSSLTLMAGTCELFTSLSLFLADVKSDESISLRSKILMQFILIDYYTNNNELDKAEKLISDAIASGLLSQREAHSYRLSIAFVYGKPDFDKAKELYLDLIRVSTMYTKEYLALVLESQNELVESDRLYTEIVSRRKSKGDYGLFTQTAMLQLAGVQRARGLVINAFKTAAETLLYCNRGFGKNSPVYKNTLDTLNEWKNDQRIPASMADQAFDLVEMDFDQALTILNSWEVEDPATWRDEVDQQQIAADDRLGKAVIEEDCVETSIKTLTI